MSWINLFSKEEFTPYARIRAKRDVIYCQQTILEERLQELKDADKLRDWLQLSIQIAARQKEAVDYFERQPPLKSNHLNAIIHAYHEVDKKRLQAFSRLSGDPETHWFAWDDYQKMRLREEIQAEKRLMGRLSDLMDPQDAELRAGIYLYRLLDLLSSFADKLCSDGEFDNPMSFLSNMSSVDSVSEAISLVDDIAAYTKNDVEKWANTYATAADLSFSESIYGADPVHRGIQQLVELTWETYKLLNETRETLSRTIKKSTGPDHFPYDELSSEEWGEFLEAIEQGFTRYNDLERDRSIFLSTCFRDPRA